MQRNRYDSLLVWYYANQRQQLIPDHIRQRIPPSTASTWRNLDYSQLIGHELRDLQVEAIDQYALLQEHQRLKRVVQVITRVWVKVAVVVCPIIHRQQELQELFVDEVQQLFTVLSKASVLRLVRLSPSAFRARLERVKQRCGVSTIGRCFKRHPLQLSSAEVQKIKQLFSDPEKACWPAASLYYHGLRHKKLFIAQSTFYKYVNALGLKRRFPPPIYKRHGLRAMQPNQYLHVDTTEWVGVGEQKMYFVFVTDNYSKAILGATVSLNKRAENVRLALKQAIKTIHEYYPNLPCTELVSDDGRENKALTVRELIAETARPSITQIIAQKDITFSNSAVEAVNWICYPRLDKEISPIP